MKVWLITAGEPLPTDGAGCRLLRTGMLAAQLQQAGHDVTWWTSAFDHVRKQHRNDVDCLEVRSRYQVRLLRSRGYRRNVSLQRWRDHRDLARDFARETAGRPVPDVILCSLPTLELCDEATAFGRRAGCPVIIDVRDLWPDVFLDLAPRFAAPLMNLAIQPLWRIARRACRTATAIVGITDPFVEWGVNLAGRARTTLDRVFPMAYQEQKPPQAEIEAAERYWRAAGVIRRPGRFTVCFFGSINRHFEMPTVIAAARELQRQQRDVKFIICGDGARRDAWQRLAQDCVHVRFPGWVDAARIWALMRISDAGIAPYVSSRNFVGNLPNKPIEYLSASLPVISSLQGVLAELLDEHRCGLTYQNGNAAELAQLIAGLMDQPADRERMSANARRLYQREFVAEKVYRDMEAYLTEVARHGRRLAA